MPPLKKETNTKQDIYNIIFDTFIFGNILSSSFILSKEISVSYLDGISGYTILILILSFWSTEYELSVSDGFISDRGLFYYEITFSWFSIGFVLLFLISSSFYFNNLL